MAVRLVAEFPHLIDLLWSLILKDQTYAVAKAISGRK